MNLDIIADRRGCGAVKKRSEIRIEDTWNLADMYEILKVWELNYKRAEQLLEDLILKKEN